MTPTPSTRPTTPRLRNRPSTPPAPLRRRVLRRAAGSLLAGLAVTSAASLTSSFVPSSTDPLVSVSAQTAAAPTPIAAPVQHKSVRASRSRNEVVAKRAPARHVPTKRVVRLVPVGATFSGQASWYGGSFNGQRTANGEHFDTNAMTAASKTLPFGTHLRVCHSGCVVVRINDRGPYVGGRVLDLSHAASNAIGFSGVAHVTATPVATRTVTVVDTAALAKQRAHEAHLAHAAKVLRSQQLKAAAFAHAQLVLSNKAITAKLTSQQHTGRVPASASAAVLLGSTGGLLGLRRRRP